MLFFFFHFFFLFIYFLGGGGGGRIFSGWGRDCLEPNFRPGYCVDVNSVVHQTEKVKKLKLLRKQNFYEFLKDHIYENWLQTLKRVQGFKLRPEMRLFWTWNT